MIDESPAPPPSAPDFWLYESWRVGGRGTVHRIVVHADQCRFCNHGTRLPTGRRLEFGEWHKFYTLEEAVDEARLLAMEAILADDDAEWRMCSHCLSMAMPDLLVPLPPTPVPLNYSAHRPKHKPADTLNTITLLIMIIFVLLAGLIALL